jgi:hypothetical protein
MWRSWDSWTVYKCSGREQVPKRCAPGGRPALGRPKSALSCAPRVRVARFARRRPAANAPKVGADPLRCLYPRRPFPALPDAPPPRSCSDGSAGKPGRATPCADTPQADDPYRPKRPKSAYLCFLESFRRDRAQVRRRCPREVPWQAPAVVPLSVGGTPRQ